MNIEGYMTWLVPMAKAIAYNPADADDLVQEGAMGILRASRTFNPVLGVPFEAYARQKARGAMIDYYDRQPSPADELPEDLCREDVRELDMNGLGLDLRHRNILILRAAGYTNSEIGGALGVSEMQVSRIGRRAAKALLAE